MDELIRLEGVTAGYGSVPAIEDVDLSLPEGDFVGIVGPSGSGKTTLLRLLAGALKPMRGVVARHPKATIGYVPQVETVNWYFPVTVREAVLMAKVEGKRSPWTTRGERHEADAVLERLGLAGLGDRHIRELSGGQQQRVFIARAMLRDPWLLLLDEPTSGVDVRTRHDVMHVIHELHHDGLAVVMTTHDLNGIAAHLPRLVCLNRTIVAVGRPADVIRPEILERLYGAPLEVLQHGGMPVVVEHYPEIAAALSDGHEEGEHHAHPA